MNNDVTSLPNLVIVITWLIQRIGNVFCVFTNYIPVFFRNAQLNILLAGVKSNFSSYYCPNLYFMANRPTSRESTYTLKFKHLSAHIIIVIPGTSTANRDFKSELNFYTGCNKNESIRYTCNLFLFHVLKHFMSCMFDSNLFFFYQKFFSDH